MDLVFPRYPPTIDGIGDHTQILSQALQRRGFAPRVLTRYAETAARYNHGIGNSSIEPAVIRFRGKVGLHFVRSVIELVRKRESDLLIIQFEQFAYGKRGFNPFLPLLFSILRLRGSTATTAVIVHETWPSVSNLRTLVMTIYQRIQLGMLVRSADLVFVTTPRIRGQIGMCSSIVLPMFSNLPDEIHTLVTESSDWRELEVIRTLRQRSQSRRSRPSDEWPIIVVWFGNLADTRLPYFEEVIRSIRGKEVATFLYIGRDEQKASIAANDLGDKFISAGMVDPIEVRTLLEMSAIGVAPFVDGVSMRRGSFLAMLQSGCHVVATEGEATRGDPGLDQLLSETDVTLTPCEPVAFGHAVEQVIRSRPSSFSTQNASAYRAHCSPRLAAEVIRRSFLDLKAKDL